MSEKNAFTLLMSRKQTESPDGFLIIKGTIPRGQTHLLQFDGGANPNPGRAAGAAILYSPERKPIFERAEFLPHATNNQAEYTGLLVGLQESAAIGVKHLMIQGDSQLVILQVAGKWKIKDDALKALNRQIQHELESFEYVAIRHVFREKNTEADRIANEGISDGESFIRN